jgi:hypothetical protein
MVSFVERFDLPPDMHPDALETKMREEKEAKKATPSAPPEPGLGGNVVPMVPPGAQPPPGPPQGGAPGASPLGEIPPEMQQQLLSMPPAQAIQTLLQALEKTGSAPPELMQMLQQALSLPPQQQAEVIQQVVGGA